MQGGPPRNNRQTGDLRCRRKTYAGNLHRGRATLQVKLLASRRRTAFKPGSWQLPLQQRDPALRHRNVVEHESVTGRLRFDRHGGAGFTKHIAQSLTF